jgi:hypothetical protein
VPTKAPQFDCRLFPADRSHHIHIRPTSRVRKTGKPGKHVAAWLDRVGKERDALADALEAYSGRPPCLSTLAVLRKSFDFVFVVTGPMHRPRSRIVLNRGM